MFDDWRNPSPQESCFIPKKTSAILVVTRVVRHGRPFLPFYCRLSHFFSWFTFFQFRMYLHTDPFYKKLRVRWYCLLASWVCLGCNCNRIYTLRNSIVVRRLLAKCCKISNETTISSRPTRNTDNTPGSIRKPLIAPPQCRSPHLRRYRRHHQDGHAEVRQGSRDSP